MPTKAVLGVDTHLSQCDEWASAGQDFMSDRHFWVRGFTSDGFSCDFLGNLLTL
jgi:hypothetical protein